MPEPHESAAAPPSGPASAATVPPRRRWLRRLLLAAGALVLLLGIGVALLPTILSTAWARGRVESAVAEAAGRSFTLAGLDVGWSRTVLTGVRLGAGPAASDGDLLTVERIEVEPDLRAALGGDYRVPRVVVTGPVVRVDLRERKAGAGPAGRGTGGGGDRGGTGGGGAESTVPPFSVHAEVRGGRLVVVLPDGTESAPVSFSLTTVASRDGPATVDLSVDLPGGGTAAFRARATPFANGRPVEPEALDAEVLVEATDVALEGLLAFVRPFADLRELGGRLTLKARVRTDHGNAIAEDVAVDGRDLVVAGPVLGEGRRVREPALALRAAGLQRSADGALEARDATLQARGIDARGSLLLSPAGAATGMLSGKGALAPFVERARAWGLPSEGAAIGDFTFDVRLAAGDGAQRANGAFGVRDLQVSPGGGRSPVSEPSVAVVFDVLRRDDSIRVDGTSVECGFLTLRCSGEVGGGGDAEVAVSGRARLAPLVAVARAFGVAPPGEIGGDAEFDARLRRKGDAGEASGTLTLLGFAVLPPGEGAKPVREERVEIAFDAAPGKERVDVRSLSVRGGFASLSATGSAAADGASGTLETEVAIDAAPALAVLRTLGVEVPAEVSGRLHWQGPLSWSGKGDTAEARGRATLRDLVVTLPGEGEGAPARTLRESLVEADVDAGRSAGAVRISAARLRAEGVDVTAAGTVAADGALDVSASGTLALAPATARGAALGLLHRDPAPRGRLEFEVAAAGPPAKPRVEVKRLVAVGAEFTLDASGSFDPEGPVRVSAKAGGDVAAILDMVARAGLAEPVKGAAGTVAADVTASAADGKAPVAFGADLRGTGLRWLPAPDGKPWTQDAVETSVKGTWDRGAETVAGDLSLRADAGTATVTGAAALRAGARTVDARGTLDMDAGRLLSAHPSLRPEGVEPGRVAGTFSVRGPLREPFDLEPLAGDATLRVDRVRTEYVTLTDCTVEALLQGGAVATKSLAAKANGGDVTGRIVAALSGVTRRHVADLDAKDVRMDGALAALVAKVIPIFSLDRAGEATGLVDARCRLAAEGADGDAVEKSLAGEGSLAVRDGALRGSGIVAGVLEVLKMGKEIRFSSVTSDFTVRDRRVWNERITVDGVEQEMVLKGSTSFDGDLDYRVGAKFLKLGKKKQELIAPVLDKDGYLPFTLAGTLKSPRLKAPDLKDLLGGAVEGLLKKGLDDLLGK